LTGKFPGKPSVLNRLNRGGEAVAASGRFLRQRCSAIFP
jgi:hypothetical protein